MRAVNLLPRDTGSKRGVTPQQVPVLVGAGVGVLVVAVLGGGYMMEAKKVAAAQHDLDAAKAQLAATPLPPSTPTTPTNTTPAAVAADQPLRLQAVSAALSQRIAWDRVLREVSLVLPTDVWLQSLTMNAPTAAAAGPGAAAAPANGFQISGTTYSYDSVARLLSRLSLVPDLTGVALTGSTQAGRLVNFNVSAGIKGAPAPAATTTPAVPVPTTTGTTTTTGSSS
jgi:Tfp pilus assembly protein PilN